MLDQAGIKVNIEDNSGKRALDHAGSDIIRSLLKTAGGKTGGDKENSTSPIPRINAVYFKSEYEEIDDSVPRTYN